MTKTIMYQRSALALVLTEVLSAIMLAVGGPVAYADEDEGGVGSDEESGSGFGLQERERDRDGLGLRGESEDGDEEEGDDDDREGNGFLGNNNVSSLVLGGTILAILGAGGYAGYKLLRIQQKKSAVVKGSKA